MKFITPKNRNSAKVDWLISECVRAAVNYYAEYTEYTESEVVDGLFNCVEEPKCYFPKIKQTKRNHGSQFMLIFIYQCFKITRKD